jgi:two-component system, OmpR family, phosphate regulon response regulator PhoB
MGGLEVLVQLRGSSATRAIPVILLTAKSLGEEAAAAFDLGADYYIAKPFERRRSCCPEFARCCRNAASARQKICPLGSFGVWRRHGCRRTPERGGAS